MTLKDEIKELKVRIKKLEKDSHPPIFKEDAYEILNCRLMIIETFFNRIEKITTDKEELH